MKRCSLRAWIPLLPWPVWPLAGQVLLGQHVVVGSMTLLLAVRGNMATRSMSGPPFAFQLHHTTVWCGATPLSHNAQYDLFGLHCRGGVLTAGRVRDIRFSSSWRPAHAGSG